jgi:hypothetical protein
VLPRPVSTPFSTHVRLVSPRPGSALAGPATEFRLDEFENVTFRTVNAGLSNPYNTPADYDKERGERVATQEQAEHDDVADAPAGTTTLTKEALRLRRAAATLRAHQHADAANTPMPGFMCIGPIGTDLVTPAHVQFCYDPATIPVGSTESDVVLLEWDNVAGFLRVIPNAIKNTTLHCFDHVTYGQLGHIGVGALGENSSESAADCERGGGGGKCGSPGGMTCPALSAAKIRLASASPAVVGRELGFFSSMRRTGSSSSVPSSARASDTRDGACIKCATNTTSVDSPVMGSCPVKSS